jgi:hypothetical protein
MKTKAKFVCVTPISSQAKDHFIHEMDLFHSCRVKEERGEYLYLQSINHQHCFWVPKTGNTDWKVEK